MLKNNPCAVSVIVPVYNGAKFLKECIDSIIVQTLKEIEIIIVDDGSTDDTPSILRSYQESESRIRVIRKEHSNAGDARNAGLEIAQGKYLSFLDADDIFSPVMLEECFKTMEAEESDIVIFSADEYNMQTNSIRKMPWSLRIGQCPGHSPFHPTEMRDELLNSFQNWPWNKLFRRSFILEHEIQWQSIPRTNDLAFTAQALMLAERISIINRSFVKYRVGTGISLQQTNHMAPLAFWDAFRETKRRMVNDGTFSIYEKTYLRAALSAVIYNYESIKEPTAQNVLLDYIREHGEEEFGFAKLSRDYFLNKKAYDKYQKIIRHVDSEYKVSVVLPSLNVASYIRECIDSAIHQTLPEIEIICVDAGSTDGTLEILEEYARRDSRVKVLKSPVKSYGYQMNMGLDAARGEYFAILETDDCIKPQMFEELYQMAKENYLDIIKPDFQRFVTDENQKKYFEYQRIIGRAPLKYNVVYDPADNMDTFRSYNTIWSGIYDLWFLRTNGIRFNESPGASYQDNGFFFLTMCHAHRVVFFDKSYYMLRRDNPNSSVHSRGKVYCICDEYDFIRDQLKKEPAIEKRFAPALSACRFRNYEWNYGRISDEFRDEFLERFSQDFRKLMAAGEIHGEYFNMEQSICLRMILNAPQAYRYYLEMLEYKKSLASPLKATASRKGLLNSMRGSAASSRMGRSVIRLSAKIRGGFRCLSDNGWRYTFVRGLEHLGLKRSETISEPVFFPLANTVSAEPSKNGRVFMWLPHKIRGGVKCLQDHGWRYTFNRLLFHLKLVPNGTVKKKSVKNQNVPSVPNYYHYYRSLDQSAYPQELVKWFERRTKTPLNLDHPKTYNEKIQWMKLYDSTPLKTRLADKYLVREFVADTIGEGYLVPLLGVWDSFDAIDFSTLPQKFVLKTNHGCASNIIVTDKGSLDVESAKKKMDVWMDTNYAFQNGLELQYLNIPPKIIAEEYLENAGGDLKDYKVFCFNGKADCIMYLSDRKNGLRMAFYDLNWKKLDFTYSYPRIEEDVPKPKKLDEIVALAEKLAAGFAHVRVDFYVLNDGSIKFGKMTFTSAGGACVWSDEAVNRRFGELITLPLRSPIPKYEGYDRLKQQMLGIVN